METAAFLHGAASTTEHRVQVFVLGAPGIGRVRSTAGVSMVFDAGRRLGAGRAHSSDFALGRSRNSWDAVCQRQTISDKRLAALHRRQHGLRRHRHRLVIGVGNVNYHPPHDPRLRLCMHVHR